MRPIAILFLLTLLTPAVCAAQEDRPLEGCVAPEVIAKVLGEMRQENSRPLSERQFRAMWPVELSGVAVKSTDNSRFLQSNDRILNGHYQCSEIFKFDAPQVSFDAPMELRGVTVNYSARRRDTLTAVAKLFARAVGLGEADLKAVGSESSQGYQWEKVNDKGRRLYVIELRFAREDGLWKMYFSTAFYVVEP